MVRIFPEGVKVKKFPELQRDHRANGTTCVIQRENGSCVISYNGYLIGAYSGSSLTEMFEYFTKNLRELPATVGFYLENNLNSNDETHSLFTAAVNAAITQRQDFVGRLKTH